MEEIIEKLKELVNKNYDPYACGFTPQRSEGNYYDCFFDGKSCGTSYAAYEVGQTLGLELAPPEDDGENNEYELLHEWACMWWDYHDRPKIKEKK